MTYGKYPAICFYYLLSIEKRINILNNAFCQYTAIRVIDKTDGSTNTLTLMASHVIQKLISNFFTHKMKAGAYL